jgi:hypothetical protein
MLLRRTKSGKFILAAMTVYQIQIFQTQSALTSPLFSKSGLESDKRASFISRNLTNYSDLLQNGKYNRYILAHQCMQKLIKRII